MAPVKNLRQLTMVKMVVGMNRVKSAALNANYSLHGTDYGVLVVVVY